MKMATPQPVAALTDVNAERECLTSLSDTAQDLIRFRLYEDTEGVWVCCDFCGKWRYVAEQKDPTFFHKRDFHCKDVEEKCNVGTEKGSDQTFYETKFCAGSLVWAKRPDDRQEKNWPWWPALVEDSPDAVSQYFLLDASGSQPIAYHVTYLDAYRTCGWVASDLVKPFDPETKNAIKAATSRVSKKQRILKEALERAKNAAAFDTKDRLENFSYIAHMARLKGFIKAAKQPADTILNGINDEPKHRVAQAPAEEAVSEPDVKRGRGRPKKRKLETSESEVVNKRKTPPKQPVIEVSKDSSGGQDSSQKEMETIAEEPTVTKLDPKMDVDSGYAVDEESPVEKPAPISRRRPPARARRTPEAESESFDMSGISSPDDGLESQSERDAEGSQSNRHTGDKSKKRGPAKSNKKKEAQQKATENVKAAKNKRSRKNSEKESEKASSEPMETLNREVSPFEDSVVESLPATTEVEAVSGSNNTIPDSPLDFAESKGTANIRDSEAENGGPDSMSLGFESSEAEVPTETVIYDSEPNTLESTPNLKVVRKRRPKVQDAKVDENKPPKPAFLTQAPRKEKSTKTLGLSKRLDSVTSARRVPDSPMSQPLPSKSRGKFAPPTRAKPKDGDYTFDDIVRDIHEDVI